jgi:CelD/BcsL family acetyltransferase involved in cellulose biosynthesis
MRTLTVGFAAVSFVTPATHQARVEVKVTDAQLTFYLDGKASAERVVLHQTRPRHVRKTRPLGVAAKGM